VEVIARLAGREERVRVARTEGGGFEVTVGERTYRVEAVAAGRDVYSLRLDGEQHEVAVLARGEGAYLVGAGAGSAVVELDDPLAYLARGTSGGQGGRRRRRVTAYMPGRVVAVLVEESQAVTAGQGVVVLEAMKMQNESQAEHDGVVARILVQPGQAVEGGDPLFEME
jgi:biotin carboxyl carrier protein